MAAPSSWSMPPGLDGLRVLAFADWYTPEASGGAERAAWEVYRRLGAAGAHLRVISAAHGPPHQDPGVEVCVVRGYDLSKLAGAYLAPAPAAFTSARREHRAFRPHAIHANTLHYTGSVAAAWLAKRTSTPLVTTVQLGSVDQLPPLTRRLANAYERTAGRYILRRSTRILCVSNAVIDHARRLGARSEAIALAPNGVDHERFSLPRLEPGPVPTIITVGRLLFNKGPHLLVDAAGILRDEGHRFRVVFVGDGPMRPQLEEQVRAGALGDWVEFAGQVTDVESWYGRSEIVVRSSYTEGLALAVLEAMAAGRCNVVSDIPPNLELIRDGETGLTFRCGDAADLARALGTALADPALRSKLAHAAEEESRQYSWDRMAASTAEALVSVARRSSG